MPFLNFHAVLMGFWGPFHVIHIILYIEWLYINSNELILPKPLCNKIQKNRLNWQAQISRDVWRNGLVKHMTCNHTTKHLHSGTFVLNCVMFIFRSGGLGNSCFFPKYKHDVFKKKTFRVYSSLRNEVRSCQPVLQCVIAHKNVQG